MKDDYIRSRIVGMHPQKGKIYSLVKKINKKSIFSYRGTAVDIAYALLWDGHQVDKIYGRGSQAISRAYEVLTHQADANPDSKLGHQKRSNLRTLIPQHVPKTTEKDPDITGDYIIDLTYSNVLHSHEKMESTTEIVNRLDAQGIEAYLWGPSTIRVQSIGRITLTEKIESIRGEMSGLEQPSDFRINLYRDE